MKQFAKDRDFTLATKNRHAFVRQVTNNSELPFSIVQTIHVAFGNIGRRPPNPRIKQHQVTIELIDSSGSCCYRLDRNFTARMENNMIETAVGRQYLILGSNGFLENLLLDNDAFSGKLRLGRHLSLEGIQEHATVPR